jgi:hypothetical protein
MSLSALLHLFVLVVRSPTPGVRSKNKLESIDPRVKVQLIYDMANRLQYDRDFSGILR